MLSVVSFYLSARRSADVLPREVQDHTTPTPGLATLMTPEGRLEIYLNFTGRQGIFLKTGDPSMIAIASKPIRKRRSERARCPRRTGSVHAKPFIYADFSPRVQVGPNLYAGYYAGALGMDPMGLEDRLRTTVGTWNKNPGSSPGFNLTAYGLLGANYILPIGDSDFTAILEVGPLGAGVGLTYSWPNTQISLECRKSFISGENFLGLYYTHTGVDIKFNNIPLLRRLRNFNVGMRYGYEYPINGNRGRFLIGPMASFSF